MRPNEVVENIVYSLSILVQLIEGDAQDVEQQLQQSIRPAIRRLEDALHHYRHLPQPSPLGVPSAPSPDSPARDIPVERTTPPPNARRKRPRTRAPSPQPGVSAINRPMPETTPAASEAPPPAAETEALWIATAAKLNIMFIPDANNPARAMINAMVSAVENSGSPRTLLLLKQAFTTARQSPSLPDARQQSIIDVVRQVEQLNSTSLFPKLLYRLHLLRIATWKRDLEEDMASTATLLSTERMRQKSANLILARKVWGEAGEERIPWVKSQLRRAKLWVKLQAFFGTGVILAIDPQVSTRWTKDWSDDNLDSFCSLLREFCSALPSFCEAAEPMVEDLKCLAAARPRRFESMEDAALMSAAPTEFSTYFQYT